MGGLRSWRAFVAAVAPAGWREPLSAWAARLRAAGLSGPGWRWVAPENLHVTLAFLGESRGEALDAYARALGAELAGWGAVRLEAGAPGAFRTGEGLTLWLGLRGEIEPLALRVQGMARRHGWRLPAAPFRPHLTLARWRPRPPGSRLLAPGRDAWRQVVVPELAPWSLTAISLLTSDLRPEGPIYSLWRSIPLAPPERDAACQAGADELP